MIRSIACAAVACAAATPAAFAGPYVNVENNAGFTGSSFDGSITEVHAGFDGPLGEYAGFYVQAGPALVSVEGEDLDTELSGKAGLGIDLTEQLNIYGELSFITSDSNDDYGYATKAGATYRF